MPNAINAVRDLLDEIPVLLLKTEDLPTGLQTAVHSKIIALRDCLEDIHTQELDKETPEKLTNG